MENNIDPLSAEDREVISCLTRKYAEGASFATLNTLRSAIALINTENNSDSKLLSRFFRATFLNRPPAPKYDNTWDVTTVLEEIRKWGENVALNLEKLSLKLVMLLALGSAFRCQTLALIKLSNIRFSSRGAEIFIKDHTKTARIGASQPYAFFPFFEDTSVCIARIIKDYIQRTANLRGEEDQLLISYQRPHLKITTQSISRWLKEVLKKAEIDQSFTAHSTRHASTSRALKMGININTIKKAAT